MKKSEEKNQQVNKPAPTETVTEQPVVMDVYLDKQDLIQKLYVSVRTLYNWRKKGTLPFTKIHGKIYFKQSDVIRLLNNGKAA